MSESAAKLVAAATEGETSSEDTTDVTPEVEESQDEVDETTEEITEDSEEQEEPELPESVKEILKKNRKELRAAEARAKAAEKALAEKDAEKPEESESKFKQLYLNNAAKSALVEAGLTTGTDRFLKMLDLSEVEVDESGKISGLDDQIEDLKEDFKDLFAAPVKKTPVKADAAGRREAPAVKKSSAELHAERLRR